MLDGNQIINDDHRRRFVLDVWMRPFKGLFNSGLPAKHGLTSENVKLKKPY